tara:strand:- start:40091 stop:40969 length:879 start_codon:yes stop_codon:yes gene_type:complete
VDLHTPSLNRLLDLWLDEDLGRGDLTRFAINNAIVSAHWVAKSKGVFCGGKLVEAIFHKLDQTIQVKLLIKDGDEFEANQILLTLKGPASALLAGERTSLNLAMKLCGIATATALLVKDLKDTGILLADTRKTTPGLRVLEKYAIRCGGGINHRMGLDDSAMLKENHIAWSDGIEKAINKLRKASPWPTRIIVEAETSEQAEQAVKGGADAILLDEMSPESIINLVPRLRELAKTHSDQRSSQEIILEVSGINPKELKNYALTGIDLISTSAPITRSPWVDLSMRFNNNPDI